MRATGRCGGGYGRVRRTFGATAVSSSSTSFFVRFVVVVVSFIISSTLLCLPTTVTATIPGTTGTLSGYDTELGTDAICWWGRSTALLDDATEATAADNNAADDDDDDVNTNKTTLKTPFPNPVVKDFELWGETRLMEACPSGVELTAYAPSEFGTPPQYDDGVRPRTGEWYDYTVQFTINQTSVWGNTIISDNTTTTIVAVQILVCELGKVGFCSPFIHEEANERLALQGETDPPDRGDRHGGTHVHSPYVQVPVLPTLAVQSYNVTVPLLVNDPGSFYAIGALQFYTYTDDGSTVDDDSGNEAASAVDAVVNVDGSSTTGNVTAEYRYDVANALNGSPLITYEEPPEILVVTTAIEVAAYVLIGIACCALLFLLYETIKHRNNNVIRVSQGNFLIVFLLAGLWASASAVLLQPKNDVYCNLANPMVFVPLQLMFSITIGRLWRIQAVVSPLLIRKLKQERSFANRFGRAMGNLTSSATWRLGNASGNSTSNSSSRRNSSSVSSSKNVRRTITSRQLARVVALFTLPQVILQVVGGALDPDELTIQFNENESTGRQICESRIDPWTDFRTYSVILLLLLFFVLLVVSYASRNLPSLLNETSSICNSTIESLIALIIGFAVIAITDAPTTSPDISYLVSVVMVITLTLNSAWRIMLPKLRMVWRGENVVISKLVSDSRQRDSADQKQLLSGVTGFQPGSSSTTNPRVLKSSVNSSGFSDSFGASFMKSSTGAYSSENSNPEADDQDFPYSHTEVPYGGGGRDGEAVKESSSPPPPPPVVSREPLRKRERVVSFKEDTEEEEDDAGQKDGEPDTPDGAVKLKDGAEGVATNKSPSEVGSNKDGDTDIADANDMDGVAEVSSPSSSQSTPRLDELRAKSQAALKRVEVIGERHQHHQDVETKNDTDTGRRHSVLGPRHHTHPRRRHHPIEISDEETPSRRLVLRMVDLHLVLSRVNQRILSGLAVSHDDWKLLQEASVDLGLTFGDEVKFMWEQEQGQGDDII